MKPEELAAPVLEIRNGNQYKEVHFVMNGGSVQALNQSLVRD